MKNEMRKILSAVSIFIVALCTNACRNNEIEPEVDPNGGGVETKDLVFSIGGISTDTKSAKKVRPVVTSLVPFANEPGEEPLFLEESVISLDDVYNNNSVKTKGIPTYTENFASIYKNFGAKVFTPGTDGLAEFSNGSNIMFLDSSEDAKPLKYKYAFTSGQWLGSYGDELMFFMSAPDMASKAPSAGVTSISYDTTDEEGKDGGVITIAYTSPEQAADQTDILFTSKNLDRADYIKDNADGNSVLMYHALAGVKFQCGNSVIGSDGKPVKDSYVNVTKIELQGIVNSGTCTITPTFDTEGFVCQGNSNNASQTPKQVAKSREVSKWSIGTTTAAFSLTNPSVNSAADGQFPDSFYGNKEVNNLGDGNYMDQKFKNTFFLIPQTLGSNAKLVVYYDMKLAGEDQVKSNSKEISLAGRKWYAGELYTYRITVKELGVFINDDMSTDFNVKTNVRITNTHNTTEYLRVAVIGNWFDNHDNEGIAPGQVIVNHAWKDSDAGSDGVAIDFNTDHWFHAGDGFWYYKHQVKGGATIPSTRTIFTRYQSPTPVRDGSTHLELTLAVQAVDASKINDVPWLAAAKAELDSLIDDGSSLTDPNAAADDSEEGGSEE